MIHKKIIVSGRVQGVYFRASTKEKAKELGVAGFVRNESNGMVYIEAEATPEVMNEFIQWCRQGPTNAEVSSCEIEDGEVQGLIDFVISY